ncbi:MAG: bifunctional hydroxymethylpyrimidine kinase/phosphomethylpyrimidine kinase, partial [Bacteroidales bacterium]
EAQIKAITDDLQVDAVKIGMLPDSSHPEIIAKFIKAGKLKNIVLDPVMVATSGDALISNSNILPLIQYLFPCADLITPNLNETQVLVKHPVSDTKQMLQAAKELLELGPKAVLIKGGHLQSEKMTDLLLLSSRVEHPFWFSLPKIESNNLHGTGCTLSSAIAFFLGNGENIEKAVHSAKNYIYQAILSGKNLHIGNGHGPVNHFFEPISLTNKKYYKKEEF